MQNTELVSIYDAPETSYPYSKIHFNDSCGCGCIQCDSYEEHRDTYSNLRNDAEVDDIWVEWYDPECGWTC